MDITPLFIQEAVLHNNYWGSHAPYENIDEIDIANDDASALVECNAYTKEYQLQMYESPALKEFKLSIECDDNNEYAFVTAFRKSVMFHNAPFSVDDNTNLIPLADVFIKGKYKTMEEQSFVFSVVKIQNNSQYEILMAPVWINSNMDMPMNEIEDFEKQMEYIYVCIQDLMRNKPEIFIEKSDHSNRENRNKKHNYKKHNKVKVVRSISLNQDEFRKVIHSTHHMNCPCWGVIGHWRHYKNGKQVWIAPYRKGRKRNDPAAYQAKEYELPKEGGKSNGTDTGNSKAK